MMPKLRKLLTYIRAVAIVCLYCMRLAYAAESGPLTVEDVIKDIPQASYSCNVDSNGDLFNPNGSVRLAPDVACGVSATELGKLLEQGSNVVLIDTRKQSEYAHANIPGSLHLAVSSLKNKSYLKEKTVVLIGSGKAERSLYSSCAELKAHGFSSVKVLQGGLLSWLTNKMPVNGQADVDSLGYLQPLELWAESKFRHNAVVIHPTQSAFKKELQNSLLVEELNAQQLKEQLKQWQASNKQSYLASVVLVLPKDYASTEIQVLREAMSPNPVLVHTSPYQHFKQLLRQHEAVMLARQHGPKKPGCHL